MFDTTINHFKSVFAHQFFVKPADTNYLLARFTRSQGMHEEFYWQSLQAIEKYIKSGLILNGQSAKGFGHDIVKLWKAHKVTFGQAAAHNIEKPDQLHSDRWRTTSLEHLVEKINIMGHPDSRYGLISYHTSPDDLFKLDQLVFELRRRTIGLEWKVGEDWDVEEPLKSFLGLPYKKVIEDLPKYQTRPMEVPRTPLALAGNTMNDVFHAWNAAFLRDNSDYEKPFPSSVSSDVGALSNSYLFLLWESLQATNITPEVIARIEWLLDSVTIDKAVKIAFRDRLTSGTNPVTA
ncbi:hypothetical protein [Shinella sp. M31]|uniref:hypothetical protein n=1 Tax=Shinella sp. M31 TaxID=3368615 RepID=UPI003B9E8D5B